MNRKKQIKHPHTYKYRFINEHTHRVHTNVNNQTKSKSMHIPRSTLSTFVRFSTPSVNKTRFTFCFGIHTATVLLYREMDVCIYIDKWIDESCVVAAAADYRTSES